MSKIEFIRHTISCANSSAFSFAILSASRARLSFNFSENIATDLALFTSFCLSLDFLAAISAARCSSSVVALGTDGALAPATFKFRNNSQLQLVLTCAGGLCGFEGDICPWRRRFKQLRIRACARIFWHYAVCAPVDRWLLGDLKASCPFSTATRANRKLVFRVTFIVWVLLFVHEILRLSLLEWGNFWYFRWRDAHRCRTLTGTGRVWRVVAVLIFMLSKWRYFGNLNRLGGGPRLRHRLCGRWCRAGRPARGNQKNQKINNHFVRASNRFVLRTTEMLFRTKCIQNYLDRLTSGGGTKTVPKTKERHKS